jgi:hypothetical protein
MQSYLLSLALLDGLRIGSNNWTVGQTRFGGPVKCMWVKGKGRMWDTRQEPKSLD